MTEKESGPSGQAIRPGAGGLISMSLADEVTRLKQIPTWTSEDRHAASLVKDGPLNVLLMVLKKGAELSEHRQRVDRSLFTCSPVRFIFAPGASKSRCPLAAWPPWTATLPTV
jgi:hypothetical protein